MFDLASAGHRYIQTAQQLKQPIPVSESKLAFTVSERGGHGGVARTGATRARAWVSRNQFGHTLSSWNIVWIDGCQKNWHKFINYWYPSIVDLPAEPPAKMWRR